MKGKLVIIAGIVLILLIVGAVFVLWPFHVVAQFSARYQQVQRGMSLEQVEALMARSGHWLSAPPQFAAWDDAQLPPAEAQRISSVLRYTVRTFPVPASFELTFDNQRRVVGRHIYD